MNFRPYEKKDMPLIAEYLERIRTDSYFYSPLYIEIWNDAKLFHICEGTHGLYLHSRKDNAFFLPFSSDMDNAINELAALAREDGLDYVICPASEDIMPASLDASFIVERQSCYDEYLYERVRLETLKGKDLQSKRNHIARFKREVQNPIIRKIEKSDFPELLSLAREIIQKMPGEMLQSLEDEFSALSNALELWDNFNLDGCLIEADGRILAYTIAEIRRNTAIIHFEKARQEIQGSYQMINQEYVKSLPPEVSIINRQEDLGLEGLRKAKLSYKPMGFIRKYRITKHDSLIMSDNSH